MASFGDYNRVNTNVTAMDAQLSLNKINRDLGESRLRLSTGFKINNAEDDAAGFAIATKLKSRVAGLEQALQNVSDAKSVLGVVEGAYGSVMDNLIEMKTLATQASNQTLSETERSYIGSQIEALGDDINDIAKSASFNGLQLLDGDAQLNDSLSLTFQTGESTTDTFIVSLNAVNVKTLFTGQDSTSDLALGAGPATNTTQNGLTVINNSGANPSVASVSDDTGAQTDVGDSIYVENNDATAGGEGLRGNLLIDHTSSAGNQANDNDYRNFLQHIDNAISVMNSNMNQVGISQRSLSGKEVNLTEAITANSAAKSRIMDTDFAKEQSNSIRLQILQQTATAALSQANMGPQAVLGFLG